MLPELAVTGCFEPQPQEPRKCHGAAGVVRPVGASVDVVAVVDGAVFGLQTRHGPACRERAFEVFPIARHVPGFELGFGEPDVEARMNPAGVGVVGLEIHPQTVGILRFDLFVGHGEKDLAVALLAREPAHVGEQVAFRIRPCDLRDLDLVRADVGMVRAPVLPHRAVTRVEDVVEEAVLGKVGVRQQPVPGAHCGLRVLRIAGDATEFEDGVRAVGNRRHVDERAEPLAVRRVDESGERMRCFEFRRDPPVAGADCRLEPGRLAGQLVGREQTERGLRRMPMHLVVVPSPRDQLVLDAAAAVGSDQYRRGVVRGARDGAHDAVPVRDLSRRGTGDGETGTEQEGRQLLHSVVPGHGIRSSRRSARV